MSVYVLSTMAHAVSYAVYQDVAGLPTMRKSITIFGGAGLPSERSGFGDQLTTEDGRPIWTADGYVTPVSDSDYEILKDHRLFKNHMDAGYLKVVNYDITGNYKEVKKLVSGMEDDGKRQLNKETMKTKAKVKTASNSSDDGENRI